MALGGIQKRGGPDLLNTLQELNELVKFISGNNLDKIIADIRAETAIHDEAKAKSDAARVENEKTVADLKKANDDHHSYLVMSKNVRDELAVKKAENEKQIQKINTENSHIEAARKDLQAKADKNEHRRKELIELEKSLLEAKKRAEELGKDYQAKLDALKSITGG